MLEALFGYLFGSVSSSRAKVLAGQALGHTVDDLDRIFHRSPDSRVNMFNAGASPSPLDGNYLSHGGRFCTYCTSSINPGDTECQSCGAPAPKALPIRMPQPRPDLR